MEKGPEHSAVAIATSWCPVTMMAPADHQPSSAGGFGRILVSVWRTEPPNPSTHHSHLHPLGNVCAFGNNRLLPVELFVLVVNSYAAFLVKGTWSFLTLSPSLLS